MKYIKICENCGKEFQTNRENQKYCNQYCAGRARHKRQEEKSSLYSSYKTMQENEQQSVNDLVQINYNDEIVITTKTLAEVYECEEHNISNNFKRNEDKFIEGKHYYKLQDKELKEFKTNHLNDDPSMLRINCLYLWTKRGASRHCKMLGTDKAWDMFDTLEENYFNPKTSQLSKEDKAWLSLKYSEQDENAQYLINLQVQRITGVFTKRLEQEMDGEGRKITLSQLAKSLGKEIEMEVKTIDISDFLFFKGYLVKKFFQRIDNNTGELSYRRDPRGLLYPEETRTPWMEKQAHKQPTNKFMDEFANKGLALTKDPDARGKIMWEFTDRFENYFKQNFSKEFIYFIQNKKGWK